MVALADLVNGLGSLGYSSPLHVHCYTPSSLRHPSSLTTHLALWAPEGVTRLRQLAVELCGSRLSSRQGAFADRLFPSPLLSLLFTMGSWKAFGARSFFRRLGPPDR